MVWRDFGPYEMSMTLWLDFDGQFTDTQNEQQLFPQTILTNWSLWWRHCVFFEVGTEC
jgi:hypothetical protein